MKIHRILAVLEQDFYLTIHSLENILDIFYSSILNVIVYGFFSIFISGRIMGAYAHYFILGMILWEIVRITQFSVAMGSLNNLWSRNLSVMFMTPLTVSEYIFAHMIGSFIKACMTFSIIFPLASYLFHFNILSVGLVNMILFYLNLTFFSWSIGIAILGLIYRFGTKIQVFAWSLIYLFQPVSAVFYPVSVLPHFLQVLSRGIPLTYVFEGARENLLNPQINWTQHGMAFGINVIYFIFATWIFAVLFHQSKETGQFARNEG